MKIVVVVVIVVVDVEGVVTGRGHEKAGLCGSCKRRLRRRCSRRPSTTFDGRGRGGQAAGNNRSRGQILI